MDHHRRMIKAKRQVAQLVEIYVWCLSENEVRAFIRQARGYLDSPGCPTALEVAKEKLEAQLLETIFKDENNQNLRAQASTSSAAVTDDFETDSNNQAPIPLPDLVEGIMEPTARQEDHRHEEVARNEHSRQAVANLETSLASLSTEDEEPTMRGGLIHTFGDRYESESEPEGSDSGSPHGNWNDEDEEGNGAEELEDAGDLDWSDQNRRGSSAIYDRPYEETLACRGLAIKVAVGMISELGLDELVLILDLLWERHGTETIPNEFFPHREAMFCMFQNSKHILEEQREYELMQDST